MEVKVQTFPHNFYFVFSSSARYREAPCASCINPLQPVKTSLVGEGKKAAPQDGKQPSS